jgi:hypothetical protein
MQAPGPGKSRAVKPHAIISLIPDQSSRLCAAGQLAWHGYPGFLPRPFKPEAKVLNHPLDAGFGAGAAVRVASNMALAISINMALSPCVSQPYARNLHVQNELN